MKVCAGIILYNPDVERLSKNIEAISPQVDMLIIVDNASTNIDEVQKRFGDERYMWIKNDKNLGIATALNQLIEFADTNGCEWILTLDQDSICENNMVERLLTVADDDKIAMVSPLIMDRGIADADIRSEEQLSEVEDVRLCITSGCLTNVKAVVDVGGFNEWLFIDEVDREMSLRLLLNGYRLIRVNYVTLCHEYGLKTVTRKFLWKTVVYRNYAPIRVFYQTRNLIYMMRKYGREYTPSVFRRWVRLFFAFGVKFVLEPNRIKRLKSFVRGIYAGLVYRIPKNQL